MGTLSVVTWSHAFFPLPWLFQSTRSSFKRWEQYMYLLFASCSNCVHTFRSFRFHSFLSSSHSVDHAVWRGRCCPIQVPLLQGHSLSTTIESQWTRYSVYTNMSYTCTCTYIYKYMYVLLCSVTIYQHTCTCMTITQHMYMCTCIDRCLYTHFIFFLFVSVWWGIVYTCTCWLCIF